MDPIAVERRIASGADDVEEDANGIIYFDSSDLELVDDPTFSGVDQTIGLRFTGLNIPQGAIITSTYLQFQVDEPDTGQVALQIWAETIDNAAAFTAASGDVSTRDTTSTFIAWSPAAWNVAGAAGLDQRTPDLSGLVQQIIDRPGWTIDNAIAFVITGSGERTAVSYDGNANAAPLLHVEYTLPSSGNQAPIAEDDGAVTQSGQAVVVDVLSNDDDPDGDTLSVTAVGNPANGQTTLNGNGSITYTANAGFSGIDSFTYTISDPDGLSDTATVTVSVTGANSGPVVVERRIASGADDVEEDANGIIYFDSSDLELVDDPTFSGGDQTVGLRFTGLNIPQGAIITSAYLQFQVDEPDTGQVALQIWAETIDNAAAFTAASGDVSTRDTTSTFIAWSPAAWNVAGAAGLDQRTPDLSGLVQQIIDRPGWTIDNAIAFVITGSGERTAESFDGNAGAAPLLHVEYVLPDGSNQAPTGITLNGTQQVVENTAGVVIGTLDVSDPDTGDTHTLSVDDPRFEVVGDILKLTDTARLDFEAGAQVDLEVTTIDSGGLRTTQTFAVSVTDVPETRFAVIGDFAYGPEAAAVGELVASLNVDFVVTTGDNAYDSVSIDDNVGQFYSDFIGNYQGAYGPGSPVNRFFPTLGNHEYTDNSAGLNGGIDLYLDYLTLPGNERYYDFQMGPVHFFALNSNSQEPDGITSNSVQAQWLQNGLAASTSLYKIVVLHHPPYSSGSHGSEPALQWPFEAWGATTVLMGHDHDYERILRDDNGDGTVLPYVVTGLGGRNIREFSSSTVDGSTARYNGNYGTVLVQASDTSITFEFVSINGGGTVVDSYTIDIGTSGAGNSAPTDLSLSNASVAENSSNGAVVGTLSTADPDTGETFTYTLLNDAGGRFAIQGNQIIVADGSLLDYETATSHGLTVRVTDSANNTYDEAFTIQVTDVDGTGGGGSGVILTGTENNDTLVGTDFDDTIIGNGGRDSLTGGLGSDTFIFGNGDGRDDIQDFEDGVDVIAFSGINAISSLADVDILNNGTIRVSVRYIDDQGVTNRVNINSDTAFTLDASDITFLTGGTGGGGGGNSAPTDLNLSNSSVAEDSGNGTVVGTLSAVDPDAGEAFTYTLLNSAGGRFDIQGNQIVVADGTQLDYETATSHSVTVQVTDSANNTYDEAFTITLTDVDDTGGGGSGVTLTGTENNDTLVGTDFDDTLIGNGGRDNMTGGLGADTFVFGNGDGRDVIQDFVDGVDMLAFSGINAISSIDDVDILNNGTTRVSVRYIDDQGLNNRVNIKSDTAFTLDASDFDFGL